MTFVTYENKTKSRFYYLSTYSQMSSKNFLLVQYKDKDGFDTSERFVKTTEGPLFSSKGDEV